MIKTPSFKNAVVGENLFFSMVDLDFQGYKNIPGSTTQPVTVTNESI